MRASTLLLFATAMELLSRLDGPRLCQDPGRPEYLSLLDDQLLNSTVASDVRSTQVLVRLFESVGES